MHREREGGSEREKEREGESSVDRQTYVYAGKICYSRCTLKLILTEQTARDWYGSFSPLLPLLSSLFSIFYSI